MAVNRDFRDLFAELSAARVKYLLVGGYALALHGLPRFTKDLDIWIEPTIANAERALSALKAFGAPRYQLDAKTLARGEVVLQIGVAPNRIDLLTRIDGVSFKAAWPERVEVPYGRQPVQVIGRRHLIKNKRATGRPQDLVDVERLLTLASEE